MIYLLDTHDLLWSLYTPEKLSKPIRQILENEQDTKFVSAVNLWEISLKYALGKLELGETNPSELLTVLLEAGYEVAPLEPWLLATYYQLAKKEDHKDPFDRLLIWQAISNRYTLITQDKRIAQYTADGLQIFVG